jgi:release factor glutamine methyltransferase
MIERRVAGEPLEHIVGWVDFAGLRIKVEPGVFVPRRRTEFLAGQAISLLRTAGERRIVVDLCCGSGAVAAAVVAAVPNVELHAVEVDPVAARCAESNLPGRSVYCGDLFAPLPDRLRGRIDFLVANAPYVPSTAIEFMPPEAREHEPLIALDGGVDGLDVHRRIASGARDWLASGGYLLIEVGDQQVPAALELFGAVGLDASVVRSDEPHATVIIGRAAVRAAAAPRQ